MAKRNDDVTRNYHRDNPQSNEANRRTDKRRDGARVYGHVYRCGRHGATCDEAEVALNMTHQTCSARFSDLKADGAIIDTGKRRLTRNSCPAAVYVVAPGR